MPNTAIMLAIIALLIACALGACNNTHNKIDSIAHMAAQCTTDADCEAKFPELAAQGGY